MKRILFAAALLAASAVPATAQPGPPASGSVASTRAVYETVKGYLLAAAEQMPEADYAFKPVATVRSFGEIVAHVAQAQHMICGAALGEGRMQPGPAPATKAAIIADLRASFEHCDRAYSQSDADAGAMGQLFGQPRSRIGILVLNTSHDFEHYGNLVTYMRIKGLVPPSSQGG
ncbi:MAG TPA: DinB family protein [Longimicrobium sp.]|nr:DinB family protein [Longimicrobium sp.]